MGFCWLLADGYGLLVPQQQVIAAAAAAACAAAALGASPVAAGDAVSEALCHLWRWTAVVPAGAVAAPLAVQHDNVECFSLDSRLLFICFPSLRTKPGEKADLTD